MRTLRKKRLMTSITIFILSVTIITSVLTKLVDNDMYRGAVETGEDYYFAPKGPSDISYWWPSSSQFKYISTLNNNSFSNISLLNNDESGSVNYSSDSVARGVASPLPRQQAGSGSASITSTTIRSDIQAVNIAIIFKNVGSQNKTEKLLKDFQACAESIVKHASTLPLHFVLLTDPRSVEPLSVVVRNLARVRARVPITVDYVDLDAATHNVSNVITRLKQLFAPNEDPNSKYRHDLFHVAPLYHRILSPLTSRLLVIDADLRFKTDVAELYKEFNTFDSNELMALAPEMSPLYYEPFSNYRHNINKNSKLGLYNYFPGLNSGIVLFNLSNMRKNIEYNELLDSDNNLINLCHQYGDYRGAKVGDQDLFTLLAAAKPSWVRTLDCGWNVQLDEAMKNHVLFNLYHICNSDIKLLHGNGGVKIPEL